MKRILVPTDFSPTAEKAFRFAVDLARRTGGAIILFHVYIPAENTFVGTEKERTDQNKRNEIVITKRLQRLKRKVMGGDQRVSVATLVGRSPMIHTILRFAKEDHVDLIIMGTQGSSGLKKTIVGSVAARLVEKSGLPVLLVPAKYELQPPRQFVFASNYEPGDKQALKLVDKLAKLYKADVTVIHFLSVYHTVTDKKEKRDEFDRYAFLLRRQLNGSRFAFHLVETSSIPESMETLDTEFPYDIMVMVRREKTLLEKFFVKSFTRNMAYTSRKPLLIIPEKNNLVEQDLQMASLYKGDDRR